VTGAELAGHDAFIRSAAVRARHGQHSGSDPSRTESSGQVKVHIVR